MHRIDRDDQSLTLRGIFTSFDFAITSWKSGHTENKTGLLEIRQQPTFNAFLQPCNYARTKCYVTRESICHYITIMLYWLVQMSESVELKERERERETRSRRHAILLRGIFIVRNETRRSKERDWTVTHERNEIQQRARESDICYIWIIYKNHFQRYCPRVSLATPMYEFGMDTRHFYRAYFFFLFPSFFFSSFFFVFFFTMSESNATFLRTSCSSPNTLCPRENKENKIKDNAARV